MIIPNHGVLQLMVASCTLIALVVSTSSKGWPNGNSSQAEKNETGGQNSDLHANKAKTVVDVINSHRRAPRYDKASPTSYVRVYNRAPGAKESFYNYETRGNTSAHTSGEAWDSFWEDESDDGIDQIERSDKTDVRVKDILRVKPKAKETPQFSAQNNKIATETPPSPKTTTIRPSTTKTPNQTFTNLAEKNNNQKKGYILWTSSDGESKRELTPSNAVSDEVKKLHSSVEEVKPKDGSHWKVVGDGGEEGWQVLDDKGEVEWKIEYDDGEWRVISTADVPGEGEWIDPEYVWGTSEDSMTDDPEYNSWQADDYKSPQGWTGPEIYFRGSSNDSSFDNADRDEKKNNENSQVSNSAWKVNSPIGSPASSKEKLQFGARRNIPTEIPDSSGERTDVKFPEDENNNVSTEEIPQSDQIIYLDKPWEPQLPVIKSGQKWVQAQGSKTWEGDNTGWKTETGGQTWVTTNKNLASDLWIPKIPGAKNTPNVDTPSSEESSTSTQDKSIRAWGTGYGSKTWKGNEWDSNVVWKTGFNSGLPLTTENTTWQFPQPNEEKKNPQVWSQPIPSNMEAINAKTTTPPNKKLDGIRIKWPERPVSRGNAFRKSPPSRRTESESWADDDSTGGVIWKQKENDGIISLGQNVPTSNNKGKSWQTGRWKISTSSEEQQPTAPPWKNNGPSKSSNLVSITWKAGGENPSDSSAVAWNQGQWPGTNIEPTWIFQGCKMTLKCGSTDETNNDNNAQTDSPDTSDDDTMTTTTLPSINIGKGWPPKQNGGKSWRPPSKSWKPPKWKQPTPPPPPASPPSPETMNPTIIWKPPPTPKISWKKPTPPPNMWKQPPSTLLWTETTPTLPEMTWKPPPPPGKWKKGPRPTKSWKPPPTKSWKPPPMKSWKPPPTKSWKPPKMPTKTWQPSIATPQPDMWPTTKPDCKDTTDATQPPQQPPEEDDLMEPPQIIIITKLPKGSVSGPNDKKDKGTKKSKPSGPWIFPSRKYNPKTSKNRKDKNVPVVNSMRRPNPPSRTNSKLPNMMKGWPKDMPPPKFAWPSETMRRWTTKKPSNLSVWKSKYSKSRTWREMLKNWMKRL